MDVVVTLVDGNIFPRPWLEWIVWPIEDSGTLPDQNQLRSLAKHLADLLRDGKNVLVTCGQGINRANLVAVRAMLYLGMPLGSAITLVRERRDPGALSNPAFVDWLRQEG